MSSRIMQVAAGFIGLSAVLHIVAPVLSGFSSESLLLLPFALVYGFLAWQIWGGKRWAAWLGFSLMLFGGIAGMAGYLSPDTIPGWVSLLIWATAWLAVICLFIVLWRDRPLKTVQPAAETQHG